MKALVLKNRRLDVDEIPDPVHSEEDALIKVIKAGICNTDIELVRGYMDFEGVPGHEFVGQVIQAKEREWVGKRVVGEINISCGECETCLQGNEKHCSSRTVLGISGKNGAFAELLTLPLKNLHLVPDSIPDSEAVFVEPLAAALQILEQVPIQERDTVLVLGDGKLGLLAAQAMRMETRNVSCWGKHDRKLAILRNKGILTSLTAQKADRSFDVVIEATGNEKGVKEALRMVRPGGTVVLKSTFVGQPRLDISKIIVDEIHLIGSRCGPFKKAIDVLRRKAVVIEKMVDGDFPLEKAQKAFRLAQESEVMKILLTP